MKQEKSRIDTSEVQGEGSYIVITRPTLKEGRRNKKATTKLQRKIERANKRYDYLVNQDDGSGEMDQQIDKISQELDDLESELETLMISTLSGYVSEWNWTDSDNNPLPQPNGDISTFDELRDTEFRFIVEQFAVDVDKKKAN
jgi:hypothetical protein